MSDKKCGVAVLGAVVGIALVGVVIGIISRRERTEVSESVNDVIERAKSTVADISEAVEALKTSTGHRS